MWRVKDEAVHGCDYQQPSHGTTNPKVTVRGIPWRRGIGQLAQNIRPQEAFRVWIELRSGLQQR
jgi:hypothetical protein